jgi:hypothetical protein
MPSLETLLGHLVGSGVELILVGGLAAVAQGASIATQDVDIVPRRTEDNIGTLAVADSPRAHRCARRDRRWPRL